MTNGNNPLQKSAQAPKSRPHHVSPLRQPATGGRTTQQGRLAALIKVHQGELAEQLQPEPAVQAASTTSRFTIDGDTKLRREDFGLNDDLYGKLINAAKKANATIMIRKTNKGSVIPLAKIGAVGKKLATKGKSSSAFFTNGNITFLGCLAKKVDKPYPEQIALIDILKEETRGGAQKYAFVPKLISTDVKEWPVPYALKYLRDALALAANLHQASGNDAFQIVDVKKIWGAESSKSHIIEQTMGEIYLLIKTTFREVRDAHSKTLDPLSMHRPPFLASDDEACYKVYVREDLVDGLLNTASIQAELAVFGSKQPAPTQDAIATYQAKLETLQAAFDKYAPRFTVNDVAFREVQVLSIATHNNPQEKGKVTVDPRKEYYEIVADYDLFMVAPSIEAFYQGDARNGLESKLWPLDYDYSRFVPTFSANHGLASQFDLDARKIINAHLANKAVQHGAEINNLFYVSDFFEPLIFVSSHASGDWRDLYFLTPKLFFELQKVASAGEYITIDNQVELYLDELITTPVTVRCPKERVNSGFPFLYNYMWTLPPVPKAGTEQHPEAEIEKYEAKVKLWNNYTAIVDANNNVDEKVKLWSNINKIEDANELSVAERLLVRNMADWLEILYKDKLAAKWEEETSNDMWLIKYQEYQKLFFACIIQLQFHYLNSVGVLMILHRDGFANAAHTEQKNIDNAKKIYFRVISLIQGILEKVENNFFSYTLITGVGRIRPKSIDISTTKYKENKQINIDVLLPKEDRLTTGDAPSELDIRLIRSGVPFRFMKLADATYTKKPEPQTSAGQEDVVVSHFLSAFYAWKADLDKICQQQGAANPFAGTKILEKMPNALEPISSPAH